MCVCVFVCVFPCPCPCLCLCDSCQPFSPVFSNAPGHVLFAGGERHAGPQLLRNHVELSRAAGRLHLQQAVSAYSDQSRGPLLNLQLHLQLNWGRSFFKSKKFRCGRLKAQQTTLCEILFCTRTDLGRSFHLEVALDLVLWIHGQVFLQQDLDPVAGETRVARQLHVHHGHRLTLRQPAAQSEHPPLHLQRDPQPPVLVAFKALDHLPAPRCAGSCKQS